MPFEGTVILPNSEPESTSIVPYSPPLFLVKPLLLISCYTIISCYLWYIKPIGLINNVRARTINHPLLCCRRHQSWSSCKLTSLCRDCDAHVIQVRNSLGHPHVSPFWPTTATGIPRYLKCNTSCVTEQTEKDPHVTFCCTILWQVAPPCCSVVL